MTKAMQPEPWQALTAQCEEFEAPEYVTALLTHLRGVMEQVISNRLQTSWEAPNYGPGHVITSVFAWRGFDTDAEGTGATEPQFEIIANGIPQVRVRWYKRLGRSMSVNRPLTAAQWVTVFDSCLAAIRSYEPENTPMPSGAEGDAQ